MKETNRKTIGILLLSAAAASLLILLFLTNLKKGKEMPDENEMAGIMADVPDAEDRILPETKSEAYETATPSANDIDSYWENCEELYNTGQTETDNDAGNEMTGGSATPEELFGGGNNALPSGPGPEYTNPYSETPEEREERHRRRREEAISLARDMSGTYDEKVPPPVDDRTDSSERISAGNTIVQRSGIISSLDDGWNSDEISSLDCEDPFPKDGSHPFKCMFARNAKIRNGQRVSVILMEDILVSGTLIPKNTHIMANCRLSERLELDLMNIEMDGRIIPLGYEAYDVDGNKGIYCPDVGTSGKQARSSGRSIIGSKLTGMMGGMARDVVNTGISLIQNKDGETTVSVPAGYVFFIMSKTPQQKIK